MAIGLVLAGMHGDIKTFKDTAAAYVLAFGLFGFAGGVTNWCVCCCTSLTVRVVLLARTWPSVSSVVVAALTNFGTPRVWPRRIAIKMLFDAVPIAPGCLFRDGQTAYLPGSGIIPRQFKAIRQVRSARAVTSPRRNLVSLRRIVAACHRGSAPRHREIAPWQCNFAPWQRHRA